MQPKIHTWKSYTFITFSVLSTAGLFLIVPMLDWFGPHTVTPVTNSTLGMTILSIIMAIVSFCSSTERKILPIIGLILTLFNTAIILFFLWFGYHFTH